MLTKGGKGGKLTNCALRVARVTSSPDTNPNHHRRLRVLATLGIIWGERTNGGVINAPHDLFAGPVDGVGVEVVVVALVVMRSTTVVRIRDTLSKVIALHQVVVASQPFPVDFVQIIGLQNRTADNTRSRGSLDFELDPAKHDIPVRLDQGGITLLGHRKPNPIFIVSGRSNCFEIVRLALSEIDVDALSQCLHRRTRYNQSVSPQLQTPIVLREFHSQSLNGLHSEKV